MGRLKGFGRALDFTPSTSQGGSSWNRYDPACNEFTARIGMSAPTEPLIIPGDQSPGAGGMVSARTPLSSHRILEFTRLLALRAVVMTAGKAAANEAEADTTARQPRDDAWWTGRITASGAGTLPKGHALSE